MIDIHYNIPRKIRELQLDLNTLLSPPIITYQEKLGNYNPAISVQPSGKIITYQEKLGNYNHIMIQFQNARIITYQEKLGNYNSKRFVMFSS